MLSSTAREYLDWSSLPDLHRTSHLLTKHQQRMLGTTFYRLVTYPQRFKRSPIYEQMAGLALMSNWDLRHKFCYCGIQQQRCLLWKFCPFCCYLKKLNLAERYLTKFHSRRWFFQTISYRGEVNFTEESLDDVEDYWNAGGSALRRLKSDGQIDGAVWSEEISVHSFDPLLVRPHIHALLTCETVSESHDATTQQLVEEFVGNGWDPESGDYQPDPDAIVRLQPDSLTLPLQSQADFSNVLFYMIKPINLAEPYNRAFSSGTADVLAVNQNVNQFFAGHRLHTDGRKQLQTIGNLDPRNRSGFIGVSKEIRATSRHKTEIRQLLKALASENTETGLIS